MVMASAVLTAVNWSPKAYPEGWALIKAIRYNNLLHYGRFIPA